MKKYLKRIFAATLGIAMLFSSAAMPLCASDTATDSILPETETDVEISPAMNNENDAAQIADMTSAFEEETTGLIQTEDDSVAEEIILEEDTLIADGIILEDEIPADDLIPVEEMSEGEVSNDEISDPADETSLIVEDISPADGIMLVTDEETSEGTITLDRTKLTMKSTRAITLRVTIAPYVYEKRHLTYESSDTGVVAIETFDDPLENFPGKVKLRAVSPGTAQITVTADGYVGAVCEVTVTDKGSTWNKSLSDINAMNISDVIRMDVYDGRDLGIMTPVNTQIGGICVAEGHIAAMETSLVKQGILDTSAADMHERNLVYNFFNHDNDPLGNTAEDRQSTSNWGSRGGLPTYSFAAFMTQWNGPVHDDKRYGQDTEEGFGNNIAMPEDIMFVDRTDRDTIKRLIVEYGAVAMEYYSQPDGILYHKANPNGQGAHECAIVGWDDTVEKENFTVANYPQSIATEDGAWIVKNSWGEERPKEGKGYFYLSYEAPSIRRPIVYKMMSRESYDYNYFYDGVVSFSNDAISPHYLQSASINPENILTATFKAQKDGTEGKGEYLEAVNIGVASKNTKIQVEVYTNVDEKSLQEPVNPINGSRAAATGERTVPYAGFYTIRLNQPVKLEKDQYFTIAIKMPEGGEICTSYEASTNDLTFRSWPSGSWTSGHPNTLRLKAFTKLHNDAEMANIYPNSVVMSEVLQVIAGDTVALDAAVSPENVLDRTLIWTSSDESVAAVDYSGRLTAVSAGTATVTVETANGLSATCEITVTESQPKETETQKPEPQTPQEEIKPSPAPPQEETKPSPIPPQEETKPSPTPPQEEIKPSPAPPQEETKPADGPTPETNPAPTPETLPATPEQDPLPTLDDTVQTEASTETPASSSTLTTDEQKPAVAKSFKAESKKKKTASLTWKKVSGAKGYEVQYALNKKFTKQKKSKFVKKPKLTVKKLKKGKTYYFRIRAYKVVDGRRIYGEWTSPKKIKIRK